MKLRIYKQNFITLYVTILIIVFAILGEFIESPLIQYADELFTLFAFSQILLKYNRLHKNYKLNKLFKVTLTTLIVLVIVGLISNVISKVILNPMPIAIDLFGMIKLPIVFLYVYGIVSDKEKK